MCLIEGWESQFERMKRALARVQKPECDEDAEIDNLYSFFQNCWHLKDWIANDDSLPRATRDAIVKAAEDNFRLQICADLANGSKHLKLKFQRRCAVIERITIEYAAAAGIAYSPELRYGIEHRHGLTKPPDVTGFAYDSVEDWKKLLAAHGLIKLPR